MFSYSTGDTVWILGMLVILLVCLFFTGKDINPKH